MRLMLQLAAIIAASIPLLGAAQDDETPALAPQEFPAVTYACVPMATVDSNENAALAVEEARERWVAAAQAARLDRASPLFAVARIQVSDDGANPDGLRLCGIIADDFASPSFVIERVPARSGLTGYCPHVDVDRCLVEAAAAGGYTAERPWPHLPVYAPWSEATPPTDAARIITFLSTNRLDLPSLASGQGTSYERSDTQLRPLRRCEGQPCEAQTQPAIIPPMGTGIVWFIPLENGAE